MIEPQGPQEPHEALSLPDMIRYRVKQWDEALARDRTWDTNARGEPERDQFGKWCASVQYRAGADLLANAPTILAGLAALEVVNNLRVRLSAVQFNYASELGIQAESLMQLEQSLGESFESLGDAIASAVAALEERDKLRALLARCDVHMRLARVPGLVELVPNPLSAEIAAALQPTPETNKEK